MRGQGRCATPQPANVIQPLASGGALCPARASRAPARARTYLGGGRAGRLQRLSSRVTPRFEIRRNCTAPTHISREREKERACAERRGALRTSEARRVPSGRLGASAGSGARRGRAAVLRGPPHARRADGPRPQRIAGIGRYASSGTRVVGNRSALGRLEFLRAGGGASGGKRTGGGGVPTSLFQQRVWGCCLLVFMGEDPSSCFKQTRCRTS